MFDAKRNHIGVTPLVALTAVLLSTGCSGRAARVGVITPAGDDHPARLYLNFESASGESHSMEIIWGNQKLGAGDWKILGFMFGLIEFPHYVANGGAANVGRWHREQIDMRDIYRELWGDPTGAHLNEIALFCDTDETGATSVAYFGPITVRQHGPATSLLNGARENAP